jgi:O-acetyl-ADP-ribose deacetylase (regulator of RNase III)
MLWAVARLVSQDHARLPSIGPVRDPHVDPFWQGSTRGEPEFLDSRCPELPALAIAQASDRLHFPVINCGIYGYPISSAAQIAINTAAAFRAS